MMQQKNDLKTMQKVSFGELWKCLTEECKIQDVEEEIPCCGPCAMRRIKEREIELAKQRASTCVNCGGKTEVKAVFRDGETGERFTTYFDLCEKCKLIPNCFTCMYSKMWYFRYKGRCDKFFHCYEYSRPDCKLFRTKQIGDTKEEFWNHAICRRYRRGDATKQEFEEANYHD